MMDLSLLGVVSIIFFITALGSVINHKFLNWPNTIAVMLLSTILSMVLFSLQQMDLIHVAGIGKMVKQMDFAELLLHWLLPVLLFAGALHVPFTDLRKYKFQIFTLATLGLIISSLIIAWFISSLAPYLGFQVTFLQGMVFGVLISSTDPVCVLGILSKGNISLFIKKRLTCKNMTFRAI